MKKTVAVVVSVLCYTGMFLLLFYLSVEENMRWLLLGFPAAAAVYFIIAGGFFARRLHLNRWLLWLSMHFIGSLCSLIILLVWYPEQLMSEMTLSLAGMLAGAFAVVWAVTGLGFLCAKWCRDRAASSGAGAGRWRENAKKAALKGGVLLLILAVPSLYQAVRGFRSVRPAADYQDSGVHTFAPYDILPIQVQNGGNGRSQRDHATKIVYMVYYRTTDGSGYRWQEEGGTARTLAEQLYDRGPVERRVLSIPADDTYITVEANQTAESYTQGLRRKYLLIGGLAGGYMLVYAAAWAVIWSRKQRGDTGWS